MNSIKFVDWLEHNLLIFKQLADERDVVLIIDNAPYRSGIEHKVPTKNSSKKQEMIAL